MSEVPEKHIEFFVELIAAAQENMLTLIRGYFNGEERSIVVIEGSGEDENGEFVAMWPKAIIIDPEKDSLHDWKKMPLGESDIDWSKPEKGE